MPKRRFPKAVEPLTHGRASRKNIPTAEFRSVMDRSEQSPVRVAYERRNRDLDPQLVWRGKDLQDWSDLVVQAPPLYIQEKVHPKVLVDDLRRRTQDRSRDREDAAGETQPDFFADFNGLPDEGAKTEFYQHDANWSNRMILGDSLQVMASLAEREGLRGKVQCIYLDPPYGIKFNSNFQWSTTSRDVKDGKAEHISREPEQVKAFRDTWRDGVHSYLTYLRDRLTVARDLLAESGSVFVQIRPYEDKRKVRVAGPFTVESLSPHRVVAIDENDELLDRVAEAKADYGRERDFVGMILERLEAAGVQQAHKEDRIDFAAVTLWPGSYVCAEGRYAEGRGATGRGKRAGIFVGPQFGTVSRPDLVAAAREAGDAGFDVLIACAFSYEAQASEFDRLGRIPVLKARMNADLHMAGELKNTGKGNLFVVFGEPDIDILSAAGDGAEDGRLQVKINGVDVFHPNTGEVRSDGAEGIACWFIDTDYNEESFFVRHAYFLGANDPYKALKTTLKAEIDPDAWASLHSDVSRPFDRPESGRIAVKVINHLGDEVMKVFRV